MNEFQGHLWDTEGKPVHDVFQGVNLSGGKPAVLTENDRITGQAPKVEPADSTGLQLKEEGIRKVSENNENWLQDCVKFIEASIFGSRSHFTGEDIRFDCENFIGFPRHHNAWGALINTLLKRKIIVPTGEYRPMKDRASHARRTPVYRRA